MDITVLGGKLQVLDAVIADTETTSGWLDCRGSVPWQIAIPAGFDGTSLEIEGSMNGTDAYDLYDAVGQQVLTVAAAQIRHCPVEVWGVPYLRFVADAQTGAVTLSVAVM